MALNLTRARLPRRGFPGWTAAECTRLAFAGEATRDVPQEYSMAMASQSLGSMALMAFSEGAGRVGAWSRLSVQARALRMPVACFQMLALSGLVRMCPADKAEEHCGITSRNGGIGAAKGRPGADLNTLASMAALCSSRTTACVVALLLECRLCP
jgi:hypothetical protein